MFQKLKNFFLPHENNDHHPHLWQMQGTIAFLVFVTTVEALFFVGSYLVTNKNNFLASVFPAALVALTNDVRTSTDLPQLKENDLLIKAAKLKALDMATRGYFSHNTPEGDKPWIFLNMVGYSYEHAGENLAINFVDSKDIVDAWVRSPSHYANLVKDTYTEIGIATAQGVYQGRDTVFVVEFFGTPKSSDSVVLATNLSVKPEEVSNQHLTNNKDESVVNKELLASTTSNQAIEDSQSEPKVFGEETDASTIGINNATSAYIALTYPRHLVSVVLSVFGIIIVLLLIVSIRRHNAHVHERILQIAIAFIIIIGLVLILNYLFGLGRV